MVGGSKPPPLLTGIHLQHISTSLLHVASHGFSDPALRHGPSFWSAVPLLQQPSEGLTEQVKNADCSHTSTFSTAAAAAAAAWAAASVAAASVAAASASSACSIAMPAATAAAELRRRQGALIWFMLVTGCRGNMPPLTCIINNFDLT